MKISSALALLCVLGVSPARAEDDKAFKIAHCDVFAEHTAAIAFRNDAGQGRYIMIMDAYRQFKIGGSGNAAFRKDSLKGILGWDKVTAIRTLPTDAPGMAGHLRIDYRLDGRNRAVELGAIDEPCLTALKRRYATQLEFEPP